MRRPDRARARRRRPRRRAGVAAVLAALGLLAALLPPCPALDPYVVRPTWWDSVDVPPGTAADPREWREALKTLKAAWLESSGWDLLGPFPCVTGSPLELALGPETDTDRTDHPFVLADGVALTWQRWEAGQPFPLPRQDRPQIVYLRTDLDLAAPQTRYLVVSTRRGDFTTWLNGRLLKHSSERPSIFHERPEGIGLHLGAGHNRVVLKYYTQSAAEWDLAVSLPDRQPLELLARLRAGVLEMSPALDKAEDIALGLELVRDFLALDEFANACHVATLCLLAEKDARRQREVLRRVVNHARETGRWRELDLWVSGLLAGDGLGRDAVDEAAHALLDSRLNLLDLRGLTEFLDRREAQLADVLGRERHRYHMEAAIRTGDYTRAKTIRDRIVAAEPGVTQQRWYKELDRKVEALREAVLTLALDYEFEARTRRARDLAEAGGDRELFRHIRETLTTKSGAVRATDEPDRFLGAAAAYRGCWQAYTATYEPLLEQFLSALEAETGLTPQARARNRARLGLTDEPVPGATDLAPSQATGPPLPAPPRGLRSPQLLTRLELSGLEQTLTRDPVQRRLVRPPLGQAVTDGEWAWFQTGRQLLALGPGGALAWQLTNDHSTLAGSWTEDGTALLFSPLVPAVDRDLVCARLLDRGRFVLGAVAARSGEWCWRYAPADVTLCSDPALWQDSVLILGKRRGTLSEYVLLFVNRRTGALDADLFLYSALDRRVANSRSAASVQRDVFTPAPVVADNVAYINSNAGVLAAVDLRHAALHWVRRYYPLPLDADEAVARRLLARRGSAPVLGDRTVLLAPADAVELFLVERETGHLLHQVTAPDLTRVLRFTPEQALGLVEDGRSLCLISLRDLAISAGPTAERRWLPVGPVQGGMLLQRDDQIGTLDAGGRFSVIGRVPLETEAVGRTADTLLATSCRGLEPLLLACADADATPVPDARPDRELPARQGLPAFLLNPRPERLKRTDLLVAENYLVALDPDLKPTWAFPVPEAPKRVWTTGADISLVFRDRICTVQAQTGELLRSFPPLGSPWFEITASAPSACGLHLSLYQDWSQVGVVEWTGTQVVPVGAFKDTEYVSSILNGGLSAVAHRGGKAQVAVLDAPAAVYRRTGAVVEGDFSRVDDDGIVGIGRQRSAVSVLDEQALTEVPLRQGQPEWRWAPSRLQDGLFSCLLFSGYWTVVDVRQRVDLAQVAPFALPPVAVGDLVLGVTARNRRERFSVVWYDRTVGEVVEEQAIPFSTFGDWVYPGATQLEFSFLADGAVYHVFRPEHGAERSLERVIAVQGIADRSLAVKRVPAFRQGAAGLAASGQVLLCFDQTWMRLTTAEFLAWLDLPTPIRACRDDRFDCQVDGFLDEWDPADFQACGRTAIAGALVQDRVCLALLVRDRELIRRLGEAGVDSRVRLVLASGSLLGLQPEWPPSPGYMGPISGPGRQGWEMDYSVTPTGDSLAIEVRFAWSAAMSVEFEPMQQVASHRALGDLAVIVSLDTEGQPSQRFFTAATDRHGAVRLGFAPRNR